MTGSNGDILKLPPCDLEAEVSTLGSMLVAPECIDSVASLVGTNDFYLPLHRSLFDVILGLHRRDGYMNVLCVRSEIERVGLNRPDAFGETPQEIEAKLVGIIESLSNHMLADTYAKIVRDKACRRAIIQTARRLELAANEPANPVDEVLTRINGELDRIAGFNRLAGNQVKTVVEIMQENPELKAPVIEGLLREGELLNLISASKVGKSWLTLSLLLSVATGRPWLNRFPVRRGNVLLIDNELHAPTLASRIKRVADAMNIDLAHCGPSLHVEVLRGRLHDLHSMAGYFNAIEPGRYRVIVLDAFYRFLPPGTSENDNAQMCTALYNILDNHAQRTQSAFVLVHHSSKGNQSEKSVTDVGSGAGAISRATDTHLVLRPHEDPDAVSVEAAIRSWKPLDPFCLRWNFPLWELAEDLDPTRLRKVLSRRQAPKADSPAKDAEPETTPEEFVAAYVKDEPVDKATIIARARAGGVSMVEAESLLLLAVDTGKAHKWKLAERGAPVRYSTRAPSLPELVTK